MSVRFCFCADPACTFIHAPKGEPTRLQSLDSMFRKYYVPNRNRSMSPGEADSLVTIAEAYRDELVKLGFRKWLEK